MEVFLKLYNGFHQLTIIPKSSDLNVWLSSKCAREKYIHFIDDFVYNSGSFWFERLKKIAAGFIAIFLYVLF